MFADRDLAKCLLANVEPTSYFEYVCIVLNCLRLINKFLDLLLLCCYQVVEPCIYCAVTCQQIIY